MKKYVKIKVFVKLLCQLKYINKYAYIYMCVCVCVHRFDQYMKSD